MSKIDGRKIRCQYVLRGVPTQSGYDATLRFFAISNNIRPTYCFKNIFLDAVLRGSPRGSTFDLHEITLESDAYFFGKYSELAVNFSHVASPASGIAKAMERRAFDREVSVSGCATDLHHRLYTIPVDAFSFVPEQRSLYREAVISICTDLGLRTDLKYISSQRCSNYSGTVHSNFNSGYPRRFIEAALAAPGYVRSDTRSFSFRMSGPRPPDLLIPEARGGERWRPK